MMSGVYRQPHAPVGFPRMPWPAQASDAAFVHADQVVAALRSEAFVARVGWSQDSDSDGIIWLRLPPRCARTDTTVAMVAAIYALAAHAAVSVTIVGAAETPHVVLHRLPDADPAGFGGLERRILSTVAGPTRLDAILSAVLPRTGDLARLRPSADTVDPKAGLRLSEAFVDLYTQASPGWRADPRLEAVTWTVEHRVFTRLHRRRLTRYVYR